MYLLHSLDMDVSRKLHEESQQLLYHGYHNHHLTGIVCERWFLLNLTSCRGHKNKSVDDGMFCNDGTLPLDEDGQEYSYIVLVNQDRHVILGRYGTFQPFQPHGKNKAYYWNDYACWLPPSTIQSEDPFLHNLLSPLWVTEAAESTANSTRTPESAPQ